MLQNSPFVWIFALKLGYKYLYAVKCKVKLHHSMILITVDGSPSSDEAHQENRHT